MKAEQQYIDLYQECRPLIEKHAAPILNGQRQAAFERFVQSGFPTQQSEQYKYTEVADLFAPDYGLNINRLDIPVNPYEVFKCDVPNMSTLLYFMVNDSFYQKALPTVTLPEGVIICGLNEAAERYPQWVEKYYNRLAGETNDGLSSFNTAFVQDGLFIYVPDGVVVEKPLQLVHILHSQVDLMVNRRLLIILGKGHSYAYWPATTQWTASISSPRK